MLQRAELAHSTTEQLGVLRPKKVLSAQGFSLCKSSIVKEDSCPHLLQAPMGALLALLGQQTLQPTLTPPGNPS